MLFPIYCGSYSCTGILNQKINILKQSVVRTYARPIILGIYSYFFFLDFLQKNIACSFFQYKFCQSFKSCVYEGKEQERSGELSHQPFTAFVSFPEFHNLRQSDYNQHEYCCRPNPKALCQHGHISRRTS